MTLTVPDTISVAVEPGGEVKTGTGQIVINTDAAFGYRIGIRSKTDGTALTTTENNVIPSISDTNDLATGHSAWGWRAGEWGTKGDPGSDAFRASPSSTTADTEIITSTTSTDGKAKSYYLTIGASASADQPRGTYVKDFIITATATEKVYDVVYNSNGGSAIGKGQLRTYLSDATFTPTTTEPTRANYIFGGWCSGTPNGATCPTPFTLCSPGKECKLALDKSKTDVQLTAIWASKTLSISTMQEYGRLSDAAKTTLINSMQQDRQYELKDERDGRVYYVAKLEDGNIWMTENLDLDLSTSKTLTPNDTDITANWTPTRNTLTTTDGWSNDYNTPYSYDPGNRCWNGTTIGSTSYAISDNTAAKDCNKHDSSHYHVGNYYNFSAAVAMNDTSSYTTNGGNVNQSICPKGWQLPVYEGNKSFVNLQDAINNAGGTFTAGPSGAVHQAPFYFPYSGHFRSGSSYVVGQSGWFWSSVVRSSSLAYFLYFDYTDRLTPKQWDGTRNDGRSVRCVARTNSKTINDISTMQQYGNLPKENKAAIKASMTINKQYQLTDERDGSVYYVAKLADGNIWMTENLDLDLSTTKTLTPNDTDITANWTPVRSTIAAGATGWANDNNTPYSYDPGNRCWNGTIISTSSPITDNAVAKDCSQHDSSHYHVGNYYNWSAAVAMNDTSSYTTDKANLNQSICPKGWQLPVYEGNKSFVNLQNVVINAGGAFTAGTSSTLGTINKAPFYFPYSGRSTSGASYGVGHSGWFWSSVVRTSGQAYFIYFDYTGRLSPQQWDGTRNDGRSIRCVARDE